MAKLTKERQIGIRDALERGDAGKISRYLREDWTPNQAIFGLNPLGMVRNLQIAQALIDAGFQVNEDYGQTTPLLCQVNRGLVKMVKFLLKQGADPNVGYAKQGNPDRPAGTTPLIKSISPYGAEIFRMLLDMGADIDHQDEHGHNALFHAARWNNAEAVKELLKRRASLTEDVLAGPVYHGNAELLKSLIAKGANVNCKFRRLHHDGGLWADGQTLLGYAIGNVGILEYPLKIVELLLKAGADPNQLTDYPVVSVVKGKETLDIAPIPPIRIAATRGREDMMRLLWKAGAKQTLQGAVEGLSLEKAAYRNDVPVVRLLLKAGVNVRLKGYQDKTPLELAREKGHEQVVELLEKARP